MAQRNDIWYFESGPSKMDCVSPPCMKYFGKVNLSPIPICPRYQFSMTKVSHWCADPRVGQCDPAILWLNWPNFVPWIKWVTLTDLVKVIGIPTRKRDSAGFWQESRFPEIFTIDLKDIFPKGEDVPEAPDTQTHAWERSFTSSSYLSKDSLSTKFLVLAARYTFIT
jgi:hypothetical protein